MGQKSQHGNMLSAARGQSIPFWTFATIGVLAMMLFVLNYALNVSWTIRAQNAADSASAATHSAVANVYNEESTLLYAATVDEFRLRALNQANQLTQAGQNTAAQKIFSLLNPCGGTSTLLDSAFCYTYVGYANAQGHGSKATPSVVQVVACRNVPWIGGGLFGLGAKFTAVASGASAIASAQVEHFVPSAVNGATSQRYQSNESSWFGYSLPYPAPPYEVVFDTPGSPLAVDINWYTVVPYSNAAPVAAG